MSSSIHPQARTTPKIRQEIKDSGLFSREAAKVFNITRATAQNWLGRDDVQDRSHRAHTLRTTLSQAQEAIVLALRQSLYPPLDNLLFITKQYINPAVSRAGIARLLKREGMSCLTDLIATAEGEKITPKKTFKDYEPGFIHIDIKFLPQMPDETSRRYLFVAIDRATRWVFRHIYGNMTEASSVDFLQRLNAAKGKVVPVTCIIAREIDAPPGVKPIEWRLLTNRSADTAAEVAELIDWYRARWEIEMLVNILKNGCEVEALQLGTIERIERALALHLVAAWRIAYLMRMGRTCPDLDAKLFFDPDEIQAASLLNKKLAPPTTSLSEVLRMIARAGAFLARKGDDEPGANTIWDGLRDVRASAHKIKTQREMGVLSSCV